MFDRPLQSETATMTNSTSSDAFLAKADLIESLVFADSVQSLPSLELARLSPAQERYLRTPEGMEDLRVWARTFRSTIADLTAFRAMVSQRAPGIRADDMRSANQTADRTIAALGEWLSSSPTFQRAS